ncbi:hypothetical protein, partial [Deinococcus wulumuqiensis]|uniref:hypothetical protein n=2 Tax=Deinococcus wulumuqiensis TaxID=980427 RepID=UPI001CEF624B
MHETVVLNQITLKNKQKRRKASFACLGDKLQILQKRVWVECPGFQTGDAEPSRPARGGVLMLMSRAKALQRGMLEQQRPSGATNTLSRGDHPIGGDANPDYHALKDVSLSSAPHEGSGSRPAGAT